MNKKAQAIFAGIMIFITVIIVVVQLISPVKDQITLARNVTNLDCDNTSITVMQKGTCVVVDTTLFYFVGMAIAGAAVYLGSNWLRNRQSGQ